MRDLKAPAGRGFMAERVKFEPAVFKNVSTPNVKYADLDADLLLKVDPVLKGGIAMEGGDRIFPSGAGLGIKKT